MEAQNYHRAQALLQKCQAGECTKEELIILESWYNSMGHELPEIIHNTESEQYRLQFLHNWRETLPQAKVVNLQKRRLRWMAAASMLLLAGAGYWFVWKQRASTQLATQEAWVQVNNETDHVRRITLTDGSIVWLNARAHISWPKEFNADTRTVQLTGEGYFEVAHNATKPFVVHANDINIRVLGTAFNVEAYPGENNTRVALTRGAVKLYADKDSTLHAYLKPGEMAVCMTADKKISLQQIDTTTAAAWKNGSFAVHEISVRHAIERLAARYNYQIQWKSDTIDSNKNISVSFAGQSFEQMLGNLCYMIHANYTLNNKQIIVH